MHDPASELPRTPLLRTRVNREEAGGPLYYKEPPTSLALRRGVGAEVLVRPSVGSSALGEITPVPELIGAARRWHRLRVWSPSLEPMGRKGNKRQVLEPQGQQD
jgi:hypothetical protein